MKIILVEYSWQVKKIVDDKESFKGDLIVSLDPESSYVLKVNKVPYFEAYQFCNCNELWLKYKEITYQSIKIAKVLDETLWNLDKRFRDLNWQFFNDYHFPLKITFDQLFYYSELISKLIEKYNPTEFIIADSSEILINNRFMLKSEMSVIKFLLKTRSNALNKIKVSYIYSEQKNEKENKLSNYFKKTRFLDLKNFIKSNFKNLFYKISFLINLYMLKPKYLSVGCFEILRYKKLYPNESKFFLSYHHENYDQKKINDQIFYKDFVNYLKNKTNFYGLVVNKNISFELIYHEILLKLLQQRNFFINEFFKAKKIINKIKPKCVIFQSAWPSYSANLTFRKVCNDFKIPFAVWAHGGYGVNYSFVGYDVTDFRFCENHISYGPFLRDTIADNKCVLKELKFKKNYKILPVGSPRLDHENMKKNSKRILKTNKKKTILFLTGSLVAKNRYYFGRNREKYVSSSWEFHYEILCILKKYQDKYNIIFKDYPNGHNNLWKKILKDINADKISFYTNEYCVNDLLKKSDLNIMPWISTTFFEALYFDADIFAWEEDLLDKCLEEKFSTEVFYFKNTQNFVSELEKYLIDGNFYKCDKKNSKSYFLQLDYLGKRNKLLNNALDQLS